MKKLKSGGSSSLVTTSVDLLSQKRDTSLTQRRMLTKSEIELLQKDKKDSFEKINKIFDELGVF